MVIFNVAVLGSIIAHGMLLRSPNTEFFTRTSVTDKKVCHTMVLKDIKSRKVIAKHQRAPCSSARKVGLRCCSSSTCTSYCENWNGKANLTERQTGKCEQGRPTCRGSNYSYQEANQFCQSKGLKLCTTTQLATHKREGGCGGTGCYYDLYEVWIRSDNEKSTQ
eukprot:GEMP01089594.1.p1 GENE.GEMP01089594.1~~GEMP01089594.1.p1  ORF type:complete len:164 (+),score=14.62 GEMP01089594.1:351-842(+)